MFVSDTHLPQLLPPAAYTDAAWYQRELDAVLRPAWWAVALEQELPAEGSFVSFDHVEGPVLLRRSGGRIHAYRNVCPHRLAKLTSKSCGTCPVLRSEYHGWEFDDGGATRRIPDAPSFRPLEKGRLGLDLLRVEQVGPVVFISFDPAAPPVREWLGGDAEPFETHFRGAGWCFWKTEIDLPVNWKLVIENNLESYHVGAVHAATLGNYPPEEACGHHLDEHGSRFDAPGDGSFLKPIKRHLARRLGRPMPEGYSHSVIHPTLMWVAVDIHAGFQSIVPTGPTSCRIVHRSAGWQSGGRKPLVDWGIRQVLRTDLRVWKRIIGEDLAMLPQVQAGIESPRHPGPGLVSRREERIEHFQRWLLDRLGATDDAAGSVAGVVPVRRPVLPNGGVA